MPSALAEALDDLARTLGSSGFRYYLFGAQAAIVYGAARLTADIDVSVDPADRPTRDLVAALERGGFSLRVADAARLVEQTRVLPCVHVRTRTPVDVVLTGPGPEELFHARAREVDVGGVRIVTAAPEDIVVMKVLAGRDKDLSDAQAILRAQPNLDVDAARSMLRLLEQALDRGDLTIELDRLVALAKRGS